MNEGRLRKITLQGGKKQHSISQYTDDALFVVREEKRYIDELVRIPKIFSDGLTYVLTGSTNLHTSRNSL